MWSKKIAQGLLVTVGAVNMAPGIGALLPERLESMYGVRTACRDVELLLRHRQVLLGLVGACLTVSAFAPRIRGVAVPAAVTSMGSYIALSAAVGENNAQLSRVKAVDCVALAGLAAAVALDQRGP